MISGGPLIDVDEVLGTVEPGPEGWVLVVGLSLAPVLVGQTVRSVSQILRRRGRQVGPRHGGTD